MQELIQLYRDTFKQSPCSAERLPKAGSNRAYVRLTNACGDSVIGVVSANVEENQCFIYLSRHFGMKNLPVPEILAVSKNGERYLQTDLGTTSLYDAIKEGRENGGAYNKDEAILMARTLRQLAHLQVEGAKALDFKKCLSPIEFDHKAAMFDLNYFKYCFLKTTDLAFDEIRLENDFEQLAHDLEEATPENSTFLYRDFQARNVMLSNDGLPYFIDFQGGQRGPLQYDVASFLWQASARYPQTLREEMITEYLDELSQLMTIDEQRFREQLQLFVLFRILQVLGAYGLRGYFERKKYFIDSIPPAIQNLRRLVLDGVCAPYPYLEDTLKRLAALPQFNELPVSHAANKTSDEKKASLKVRIFSFSYKKGIPEDCSGNGGGYVFDCRSTHNPGRYEPYKQQTGLDEPVIRFLEDDGEILAFLESVYRLADTHVQRYLERGFTDLMFSFGCTGGQHRSVYCAQHLAEHLFKKFGIEVHLCHREQLIEQRFQP